MEGAGVGGCIKAFRKVVNFVGLLLYPGSKLLAMEQIIKPVLNSPIEPLPIYSLLTVIPPSHRTRSHYVPKIVAKHTRTVFELSGRTCSSNILQSVYELLGRARTGRVLQNFEPAQIFLPSIPSCN